MNISSFLESIPQQIDRDEQVIGENLYGVLCFTAIGVSTGVLATTCSNLTFVPGVILGYSSLVCFGLQSSRFPASSNIMGFIAYGCGVLLANPINILLGYGSISWILGAALSFSSVIPAFLVTLIVSRVFSILVSSFVH